MKKYWDISKTAVKDFLINRKSTYCPMVWDSAFIDQHGNVYTCCHYEPGVLGNIYSNDLSEIWTNSVQLKMFRWMSLNRCLHCFHECTLLSSSQKAHAFTNRGVRKYPKNLRILFGEFCNISCVMCTQNHRSKVMLDSEAVRNNIDFSGIEAIDFQGGEVLAMKSAREMYLWLTKELHKKVNLITNGVLINEEWADHLVKGSNWIQISVNAATKEIHEIVNRNSTFAKVIDSIRKLVRLKRENGSDVKIIYKFTIVEENVREVGAAIELADYLGCDQIAFGFDASIPGFLLNNEHIRETIRNRIALLKSGTLNVDIERKRLEQLDLL
jgi:MoaA/NifB/PqqE/SkfB family radical SAM enzyme